MRHRMIVFFIGIVIMTQQALSQETRPKPYPATKPAKTFLAGAYTGLNMAILSTSGKQMGYSPEVAIRADYRPWKRFGLFFDLGYAQNRYNVNFGLISVDFLTSGLGGYYYYIYKKSLFYGGLGFLIGYQLSGQFEDSSGKKYNFENEFNDIRATAEIKLGYELALWTINLFSEVSFGYDMTSNVKAVQNPVLQLPSDSAYSIRLDVGGKYAFF
ncbi:MAG: hypothetical protein D6767_07220 [Candidatus Hydrogenedentota bacterium]|nr:MAG: hypothetical protein D6767_07220 [Candidatus Hydrogenedentota bacterium]